MFQGERIYHQGVPVDNIPRSRILETISQYLHAEETGNHLVTMGIAPYLEAKRNPDFRKLLETATLVIPESTGLQLYSCLFPPKLVNVPGGQLGRDTVSLCAERGERVVLFGSTQTNRNLACETLISEISSLDIRVIEGDYDFSNPTDSEWVADQIDRSCPGLAIMAGNEIEAETWINRWIVRSGSAVKVVGNFGQSIDVWAGKRYVPPQWAREHGLGWLLRIPFETPERRQRYIAVLASFAKSIFSNILPGPESEDVLQPTYQQRITSSPYR